MYSVESDVPIPPASSRQTYPWADMDIGDSFFVPEGSQKKIACAASRAASRLGTKFITRRMKNGVRVWRAA